ncbi:MAG: hypothetical protein L6R48_07445 [Planctomycetes bacterium]|nr:hypothetical protein [Planctomycetota bacterium]
MTIGRLLLACLLAQIVPAAEALSASRLRPPAAADAVQERDAGVQELRSWDPATPWTIACGGNVRAARPADGGLGVVCTRIDPADVRSDRTWFELGVELPGDGLPEPAGLLLELAAEVGQPAWIQPILVVGEPGRDYLHAPLKPRLGEEPQRFLLPFGRFADAGGAALADARRGEVRRVLLRGRAPWGALAVTRLAWYRSGPANGFLAAQPRCGNPSGCFEPGAAPAFDLAPAGDPPSGCDGAAWRVLDDLGRTMASGSCRLPGDRVLALPPLPPGWYELTGSPLAGVRALPGACFRSTGSAQPGRVSFAVMARTQADNVARMRALGGRLGFFGLHTPRTDLRLHELMGFPGILRTPRWNEAEGERPERADGGRAAWAGRQAAGRPYPDHLQVVTSFNPNHYASLPAWARGPREAPAPNYPPEAFHAFVRDSMAVLRALTPHQEARLLEGLWEPELNLPGHLHVPTYRAEDMVASYARFRAAVREADPSALVGGPTNGFGGLHLFERLCELGVLAHLDVLTLHPYGHTPEDVIGGLGEYRAIMRRHGRELPVRSTEAGFRSEERGVQQLGRHAAFLVRQNLVLKGEGVQSHLTFYPFDYASEGSFGICFNLDPGLGFATRALAPKPAVPALAACARLLLDAEPVGHLRAFGEDVHGYAFARGEDTVLALWTTRAQRRLRVPVGAARRVEVAGLMGHAAEVACPDGALLLALDGDPLYVSGRMGGLYRTAPAAAVSVRPGVTCRLRGRGLRADGPLRPVDGADGAAVAVPADAEPGAYVLAGDHGADWVVVAPAIAVEGIDVEVAAGRPRALATLANASPAAQAFALAVGQGGASATVAATLPGLGSRTLPLALAAPPRVIPPGWSPELELAIADGRGVVETVRRRCAGLAATGPGGGADPRARAALAGIGSSGRLDRAAVAFSWDRSGLRVRVEQDDDGVAQPFAGDETWRGDSVQVAVDTDPHRSIPYYPLAGIYDKRITALTLCPAGGRVAAWRYHTFDPARCPAGAVAGIEAEWTCSGGATVWSILLPWSELGFDAAPDPGKELGLSLLVNDLDPGEGLVRSYIPLGGGIAGGVRWQDFALLRLCK